MAKESEAKIQSRVIALMKKLITNAIVFKMHLLYITGVPDLIVVLPGGRVMWIEVKRPGEKLTNKQVWFHKQLRGIGHYVCTVTSEKEAALAFKLCHAVYEIETTDEQRAIVEATFDKAA